MNTTIKTWRDANAEIWNVEAMNAIDGTAQTIAIGFLSEAEAQAYADKKTRADVFGLYKFYAVKVG